MWEEGEDGRLMDAIAQSDENKIFETALVKDLINFKWREFAAGIHYLGAFMHFAYALILLFYIKYMFVILQPITAEGMTPAPLMKNGDADYVRYAIQYTIMPDKRYNDRRIYPHAEMYSLIAQSFFLLYQIVYECAQLCKKGFADYIVDNIWPDCAMILLGYLNIYMQIYVGTYAFSSKIVMVATVFVTMFKTFEYLRVVSTFSYIVTMIRAVLYDLRVFCLFFIIVIISFSEVLDCFGRNKSEEYLKIGPAWANIFATLRLSLGDFDFSLIDMQELYWMHVLFWVVWILMVFFSSLVFLNFIIAEVSNSYQKCKD